MLKEIIIKKYDLVIVDLSSSFFYPILLPINRTKCLYNGRHLVTNMYKYATNSISEESEIITKVCDN